MAKTFEIGQVVATRAVWELMDEYMEFNDFVSGCLSRYILYDWGDTCEEDWEATTKRLLTESVCWRFTIFRKPLRAGLRSISGS